MRPLTPPSPPMGERVAGLALGVLLAVVPLSSTSASEGPAAVIQQTALQFGTAVRGSAVERDVVVGNAGAGPLQI